MHLLYSITYITIADSISYLSTMFYLCMILLYCTLTGGQISTRVKELDINLAVGRENVIVLTDLSIYRDELVVLNMYGGVISVNIDTLSVENNLYDVINLTHVYSTVNDETGLLALCTNRKGRCQYMNVSFYNN